jgi:hypothetical protein
MSVFISFATRTESYVRILQVDFLQRKEERDAGEEHIITNLRNFTLYQILSIYLSVCLSVCLSICGFTAFC